MRIAEIAPPWLPVPPVDYGGIELVVDLLVRGLVADGHDVTLYAAPGSEAPTRVVHPLGVPVARTDLGNPWIDAAHALAAYRDADDVDVIHDHSGISGLLVAAEHRGPPVVHTVHGAWSPASNELYRAVGDTVALVAISESQRLANPGLTFAGVVPNGIDVDRYPLTTSKAEHLVFIGRSNPEKGPDRAIAIARAADRPLTMIVKRNEESERAYWREVIEPMLGSDVTVREAVPFAEKIEALRTASALVLPLRWAEPFGLVMIEALACGTPVLASPYGAASDIVVDGVHGRLAPAWEDLAAAAEHLDRYDPTTCRQRVVDRFSAAAMVAGYEAVLTRVARERRPSLTSRSTTRAAPAAVPTPGRTS